MNGVELMVQEMVQDRDRQENEAHQVPTFGRHDSWSYSGGGENIVNRKIG